MGECRNLFPWEPLTQTEKHQIEAMAPDRALGIHAAMNYLNGHTETIKPGFLIPIGILFALALGVAIVAWAMR